MQNIILMKNITMVWLWVLLFSGSLAAQNPIIRGVVKDASDESELIGVNIVKKGSADGTVSDENGRFRWELKPGQVILEFSYLGYETQRRVIDASAGEVIEIRILLRQKESLLTTVVVSASKSENKIGAEPDTMA